MRTDCPSKSRSRFNSPLTRTIQQPQHLLISALTRHRSRCATILRCCIRVSTSGNECTDDLHMRIEYRQVQRRPPDAVALINRQPSSHKRCDDRWIKL